MTAHPIDAPAHGENGTDVEKWILRFLLAGALSALAAAVLGSLDDIRRYARMQQM